MAAHIKKRSHCTKEERLDYQNIVMPMCKFGCDDLYERGIIGIKDGQIVAFESDITTPVVEAKLKGLVGQVCSYWGKAGAVYFNWHVSRWGARKKRSN